MLFTHWKLNFGFGAAKKNNVSSCWNALIKSLPPRCDAAARSSEERLTASFYGVFSNTKGRGKSFSYSLSLLPDTDQSFFFSLLITNPVFLLHVVYVFFFIHTAEYLNRINMHCWDRRTKTIINKRCNFKRWKLRAAK